MIEEEKSEKTVEPMKTKSSNEISVPLPQLANPPGLHWVVGKRYSKEPGKGKEKDKEEAKEIVYRDGKNVKNGNWYFSGKNPVEDTALRIVAMVEEKENEKRKTHVTFGGDEPSGNLSVKSNTRYRVVVVIEKRTGGYRHLHACEPLDFITQPGVDAGSAMTTIVSTCAVVVLLVTVAMLGWRLLCQRRRSSPGTSGVSQSCSQPVATTSQPMQPLTLHDQPTAVKHGDSQHVTESHHYESDLYDVIGAPGEHNYGSGGLYDIVVPGKHGALPRH